MKTQMLHKTKKSLSALMIALMIPTLAAAKGTAEGGNITGGGDPKKVSAAALKLIIEGNGLKNAMLNYVKTVQVNKIEDVQVREAFKRMDVNGTLEADIKDSRYFTASDCKDVYDHLVPASTGIGEQKSAVCFNVKMLEPDFRDLSEEKAMIRLASLAFHEHAHHFQSRAKEYWKQNEESANRLAGYILITAKFVQLPLLKWTSPSDTPIEFASIDALYQEIKAKEQVFLSPLPSDFTSLPGFQGRTDRGLIKLLPAEKYDRRLSVTGGGAYFSFQRLTHEYGHGNDIELAQNTLNVGFAGYDFGVFQKISEGINRISPSSPEIQYLVQFTPATNVAEIRNQKSASKQGFVKNGIEYKASVEFTVGSTFVLRSINCDNSDVLVVLEVRRINPDGSIIIAWKKLKEYPVPTCG